MARREMIRETVTLTVGDIREFIIDLPDRTPVVVYIGGESQKDWYNNVDGITFDRTEEVAVTLTTAEPMDTRQW